MAYVRGQLKPSNLFSTTKITNRETPTSRAYRLAAFEAPLAMCVIGLVITLLYPCHQGEDVVYRQAPQGQDDRQ
jgi:hypothetical protein